MSLTAYLTNLTYELVSIQRSDLTVHLDVTGGLNDGLDVRGEDTIVPSLAGRIGRNRKRDVRHIILSGWIIGYGSTEAIRLASYQNLCDEIESLFALDMATPGTIIGEALDGTWRQIDARPVALVWNPVDIIGAAQIAISLDSVEPDWQVTGGGS